MKPINGKAIVKREPVVDELCGLKVSERSAYINPVATVVSSAIKGIECGDVVLLSDFGCAEIGHYTSVSDESIIAIHSTHWIPRHDYVLIRKCFVDHVRNEDGEVLLYMPDTVVEVTEFVEILDIGSECVFVKPEHIGRFTGSPEFSEDLHRIENTEDFLLKEKHIKFTVGE